MSTYSLVMDLVSLAIISLCAAYYARRGFISGVFSFFGTLIALVLAGLAAYHLSGGIFNTVFRPGLEEKVATSIAEQGFSSLSSFLAGLLTFLPSSIIDTVLAALEPSVDVTAGDLAHQIVTEVLGPIITPFIMVILFFLVFSLVRVLVGVVRSLAVGLARMPAMNTVNTALGAVVGVLIAGLYIYLALCAIWAYDSINPTNPVGSVYFSKSIVYQLLSPLNFFAKS